MVEPRVAPPGPTPPASPPPPRAEPESEIDRSSLIERAAAQVAATWLDIRTEQALLGALLLEPQQLGIVKSWLRDADFFGAHHQTIYRTINELVTAKAGSTFGMHHQLAHRTIDQLVSADAFPTCEELCFAVYERLAPYGIDGDYLHTLMRACPQPSHAVVYGRMVIEADARRAVALYITRLARTIVPVEDGTLPLADVLEAADQIGHVASKLKERTHAQNAPANLDLPAIPTEAPSAKRINLDQQLLTNLINTPRDIPEVAPLLDNSDFATPLAGHLYDLLVSMHHTGTPIDILTVMWNAQRASLLDLSDDTGKDFYQRFDTMPSHNSTWLARNIQHAATLSHVTNLASTLTAALADHRISTPQILHLAASQVDELQRRKHRHSTAYQAPDGPTTSASMNAPAASAT